MHSIFKFIFRLSLLAMALIFAAFLLLLLVFGFFLWGMRALGRKLTGQEVSPFVMRMNPREGFGQVYKAARGNSRSTHVGDVVDAEVKVIKTAP